MYLSISVSFCVLLHWEESPCRETLTTCSLTLVLIETPGFFQVVLK